MATIQEQYHREADGLLWRQRQQELAVELLAAEREIGGRDPRPDDEVRTAAEQDELMRRYTEVARQGQDAVLTAVDAWTGAVEDAAGKLPTLTTYPDYHQVIDQVYDFAAHALNVQRSFAKSVLSSTASFAGERDRAGHRGRAGRRRDRHHGGRQEGRSVTTPGGAGTRR